MSPLFSLRDDARLTRPRSHACCPPVLTPAFHRGVDGDRVVRDLGARISRIAARRRQALVEARRAASGSQEDLDTAEFELGLWSEWDALTGPAQ